MLIKTKTIYRGMYCDLSLKTYCTPAGRIITKVVRHAHVIREP